MHVFILVICECLTNLRDYEKNLILSRLKISDLGLDVTQNNFLRDDMDCQILPVQLLLCIHQANGLFKHDTTMEHFLFLIGT